MTAWRRQTEGAGERHPGLHAVNEEGGHIVSHTEHVEHDMNDDTGERTKNDAKHHECEWGADRNCVRK